MMLLRWISVTDVAALRIDKTDVDGVDVRLEPAAGHVPVLLHLDIDPGYTPPRWREGDKLTHGHTVGPGDVHRAPDGSWWFYDEVGDLRRCDGLTKLPKKKLVVTYEGDPDEIDKLMTGSAEVTTLVNGVTRTVRREP